MTASIKILENGNEIKSIHLKHSLTIGKSSGSDLQLNRRNISRQHCRIFSQGTDWLIEDLNSRNGTWVNNYRLENPQPLLHGHRITLGDFELIFSNSPKIEATPSRLTPSHKPTVRSQSKGSKFPVELKREIHKQLLEDKNLKNLANEDDEVLREKTLEVIQEIVGKTKLPANVKSQDLIKIILDEALGLGPLEDFIEDETITEIMVNNWDTIYVERQGKIELTDRQFTDNTQLLGIIRRILAPIGRRIDESSPLVDARLRDGSRVNAIIPPLALNGPTVTIRKFSKKPFTANDLIRLGSMTEAVAKLLDVAVKNRQNILISGGTGSGKTTLLNLASGFIPENERIVTIEDAAELRLEQEHVVRLETRPPNIEGEGSIPIRRLVINSLRMRPDRIVIGECRGGEALDMLQAMNTGHDGSLTTLHANSPRDALARLETLVLMSGMELPVKSIRQQISSAINLIIQTQRLSDGSRRITHVAEITGMEGDVISMADIFAFDQTGRDKNAKILGDLKPTGTIPRFIHKLQEAQIPVDMNLFQENPS